MSSFKTKLSEEATKHNLIYGIGCNFSPDDYKQVFIDGAQWAVDEVVRMLENHKCKAQYGFDEDCVCINSAQQAAEFITQQVKGESE